MALFFTSNRLTTDAASVPAGELLTALSVKAWAGQAGEPASFRIGSDVDASLVLYSTSLSIELSSDGRYWGPAVNYAVAAGKVGDTVHVRALATLDELETEDTAYIVADSERLRIDFYLAPVNEFDTDTSQAYKYEGENTREVRTFFETDGEAVRVIEYEPLPKPDRADLESGYITDLDRYSVREWCNPYNADVGYATHVWNTKAFVGDRNTLLNAAYNLKDLQLSFGDTNAIILAHDFPGFNPSPQKTLVEFSEIGPEQWAYQGTVFTILRDNREYALRNIRRIGFFKGQILFWLCELQAVHYPSGASTQCFLPWNSLLDADYKEIAVIPEWSNRAVEAEPYDPYAPPIDECPPCEPCPDCPPCPECEDPYSLLPSLCPDFWFDPLVHCPDCPECPECPDCPVAPVPMWASFDGSTLTVAFDSELVPDEFMIPGGAWTAVWNNHYYSARNGECDGWNIVLDMWAEDATTDPSNHVWFAPPPFCVIGINGMAAQAFDMDFT